MIKEIGSEYWDVPICEKENNLFPESIQWFISGRSALYSIIDSMRECHTVALPSWCCDSMIKPFVDNGIEVFFYPVYWDKELHQEYRQDCDAILIMDFFGYSGIIPDLSEYKGIVIRDVTHSLFSKMYSDADYYFGSLRKWCGVWTGGYAWTKDKRKLCIRENNNKEYVNMRREAMQQKAAYISNQEVYNKDYLKVFNLAEELLDTVRIASSVERDIDLAEHLDVEFIRNRRRENADVLRGELSKLLVFPQMKDGDCPMFVPIMVAEDKRDQLRQYLISNSIYCPIHWPISRYHKIESSLLDLYRKELSLVCDQRYTIDDMHRIVKAIKKYLEA